jgi:hypothetical protein
MNVRNRVGICVVAIVLSGCLGRMVADKGMSDDDIRECRALTAPVRTEFGLSTFRVPPGLKELLGTRAQEGQFPRDDPYPHHEPPSIGCSTETRGPLRTLHIVVEIRRVLDQERQMAIVERVQEQRRSLVNPKPTIVRFIEREVWLVHRNIHGDAYGFGRGKEQFLRDIAIR